jgi:L-threonylcarbamoyladenylate synthase
MAIRSVDEAAITEAARVIQGGGLVAFPTETVYGLGANALDARAVSRIFQAKGRPASNPLIVHVASAEAVTQVAEVGDVAARLMNAFWPGPLTLVLPKKSTVPKIVTAGGATVGVRQPRHPVARMLLEAAGVPIAAPSANRSEEISPTRAEHVEASLGDAVDIILDGGSTDVGLESTVLDITIMPPRLLRPGMVTRAQIADVLGSEVAGVDSPSGAKDRIARSPGQMLRHYAPRTPLRLVDDVWAAALASTRPVAVIAITPATTELPTGITARIMPADAHRYAAALYHTLHEFDKVGADEILVETPPSDEPWHAIRDRLARASVTR